MPLSPFLSAADLTRTGLHGMGSKTEYDEQARSVKRDTAEQEGDDLSAKT